MRKQITILLVCLLSIVFTLAQTPKTAIQNYDDGIKLQDQNKYAEAMVAFEKAIGQNPNYKEALYSAGWMSNELKKYAEALTYLKKAKTLWPNEAKVYLELGYTNEKLGNKEDALECYNKCLELKSDYFTAYKYMAILYYDDKDYENALKNINDYLGGVPDTDDDDLYYRKAVCENELDQSYNALISINKADELNPKNAKFLAEKAYTYHMLKKNDEALKWYGKVLEIDNKNVGANYWTGWFYNELAKYNDALPYLKKAIELDNKYGAAYTELGYCYYALKNYDEALDIFRKGLAIKKSELSLYYSGLCFVSKKDKTAATKMLQELQTMDSKYVKDLQDEIDKM